mgnify:CR=1 FL=1
MLSQPARSRHSSGIGLQKREIERSHVDTPSSIQSKQDGSRLPQPPGHKDEGRNGEQKRKDDIHGAIDAVSLKKNVRPRHIEAQLHEPEKQRKAKPLRAPHDPPSHRDDHIPDEPRELTPSIYPFSRRYAPAGSRPYRYGRISRNDRPLQSAQPSNRGVVHRAIMQLPPARSDHPCPAR